VTLERVERCEGWGEPRLRAADLEAERAIASAQLGTLPDGRASLRRPDLVLFPPDTAPVALEVELSVKGARRLEAICRAWEAAGSSRRSATTRRRPWRVRFPAPFRPSTPTTPLCLVSA
jgi:hypothetical protein